MEPVETRDGLAATWWSAGSKRRRESQPAATRHAKLAAKRSFRARVFGYRMYDGDGDGARSSASRRENVARSIFAQRCSFSGSTAMPIWDRIVLNPDPSSR